MVEEGITRIENLFKDDTIGPETQAAMIITRRLIEMEREIPRTAGSASLLNIISAILSDPYNLVRLGFTAQDMVKQQIKSEKGLEPTNSPYITDEEINQMLNEIGG